MAKAAIIKKKPNKDWQPINATFDEVIGLSVTGIGKAAKPKKAAKKK